MSIDTGTGQADEDDVRQEGHDEEVQRVKEEARIPRLCDWVRVLVMMEDTGSLSRVINPAC